MGRTGTSVLPAMVAYWLLNDWLLDDTSKLVPWEPNFRVGGPTFCFWGGVPRPLPNPTVSPDRTPSQVHVFRMWAPLSFGNDYQSGDPP